MNLNEKIRQHQSRLKACTACPEMIGPVVTGHAVLSRVMLVGQAPGNREGELGRPFAWTAGKTLFKWFESIGVEENDFRQKIYMAAVCRCFPGKKPRGGDRVPDKNEIERCSNWLRTEITLLQPNLVIPVGKLAIGQFIQFNKLTEVIGQRFECNLYGHNSDLIPLPHPSGASTWHRSDPGKQLLQDALALISAHPAWESIRVD